MAATFQWSETNGVPAGTVTDGITNVNFGNLDTPNLASPNNRVIAGQNSYEKWNRGKFSGVYTTVENLRFYKSAGTLPANVTIKAAVNAAYATPTTTTSVVATADVPITEGTALVPTAPGASPSYSGYIIMQERATVAAAPGAVPTQTFTLKYDET
jgi:hypothetical protein